MTIKEYLADFKKAVLKSWTMWAFAISTGLTVLLENYFVLEAAIPPKYYPYVVILAMILGRLKGIHSQVKNK